MSLLNRLTQNRHVPTSAKVFATIGIGLLVAWLVLWIKYPAWQVADLVGKEFHTDDFTIISRCTPPDFEYYESEYHTKISKKNQIVDFYTAEFDYTQIAPLRRVILLGVDKDNRIVYAQIGVP